MNMSEGLIGVIIGGGLGVLSNLITMLHNNWKESQSWKKDKKIESLTKILEYAYKIKNKGTAPIYDNPQGKHLGPAEMKELFHETATLKYWMATAEIYCPPGNKNELANLRKELVQSYTAFHSFHSSMDKANTQDKKENFDIILINKVIEIANKEL